MRILAQLLHVAESREVAPTTLLQRIEARRHLLDFLHTDGLVEHTAPPHFESTGHHLVVGTHSRRSQEERIFAMNAAEVDS